METFNCTQCDKSFTDAKKRKAHVRDNHQEDVTMKTNFNRK